MQPNYMDGKVEALYTKALAKTIYFDRRFNRDAIKLLPGEYYFTDADSVLVTVVGSCVATCLWDKYSGLGGMNHFMLPVCEKGGDGSQSMLYGETAIRVLIEKLLSAGARFENLEAKLFGGSHVIGSMVETDIGERNARYALEYLKAEGINVAAQNLGGSFARKLYFFPSTGHVMMRKLKDLSNDTIQLRDRDYAACQKPMLQPYPIERWKK